MVSIQSTVKPPESLSLQEWRDYIKTRCNPKNTIRSGGLWYSSNQDSFLNQCKNLLKNDK